MISRPDINSSAKQFTHTQKGLWSSVGPRLVSPQTQTRNRHGIPSNFTVIGPNHSLNILIWNAILLPYQQIEIPSNAKQYLRLNIYLVAVLGVYFARTYHEQQQWLKGPQYHVALSITAYAWVLTEWPLLCFHLSPRTGLQRMTEENPK